MPGRPDRRAASIAASVVWSAGSDGVVLGAPPRLALIEVAVPGVRATVAGDLDWKPCSCSAKSMKSAAPLEACVVEEAEKEVVAVAAIARMVTRWEMQMGSQRPDSSIQTDRDAGAVTGF